MTRIREILRRTVLLKTAPLPRWSIFPAGMAASVIIGIADHFAGPTVPLSIFYIIPIGLTVWFLGIRYGMAMVFFSITCEGAAYIGAGPPELAIVVHVWNFFIRFTFYTLIAWLVSYIVSLLGSEKRLSRIDFLTQVHNMRSFYELASIEIERSRRGNSPLSVAYIDLDNFKKVNDRYGHLAGDNLLKSVGETLRENSRMIDTVARLGGDEFAILLPGTGYDDTATVMKRVIGRLNLEMKSNELPVSFSAGVVTFKTMPGSVDELIHTADELMYQVKKSGKNGMEHKEIP